MEGTAQASDGNSAECREATKTILEDVCMDFESMDVINPKSSKIIDVPKSRPDFSRKPANVQNKASSTGAVSTVGHSTNMLEAQNKSDPLPSVGNILLNTVVQNEISSPNITLEQSENDLLQQSYCAAVGHTTSAIEVNSETGFSDGHGNISFVSGDFSHNENIPSMAQLADAEIIQTDENSVSIIITNPRLIKVMTNADNSLSSAMATASMIDPSASMLESAIGASEQIGGISTFKIEDIGLSDNTSVLNNIFVETEPEISNVEISDFEISNTQIKEKRSKRGRPPKIKVHPSVPVKGVGRGKAPKLAVVPKSLQLPPPPPATGATTKARRITAKMKDAWAKQLQKTGCLVCHVPGCSQTYVTVANFATHYKYCTGKKNLQHCLYCDSLIFSSNKAVLQHMEVEHPDRVQEYKAKYPEACAAYDEGSLPSHLIVAEDENVAMNVEEVTQPQKKKRKLSKENVLSPPKAILKHKMKCINESVNENIKEFKKCVRFDNIVDKINSVDEFSKVVENVTEIKSPKKQKKKRVYVTGKIVAKQEYFEDDDDNIGMSQEEEEEAKNREMMHTKARMVLNLERYKRYKEYLKLTRDWSSERKTYSRSRGSDASLDTSYLLALQNEYLKDVHQMHAIEEPSANISLDISQITDSQLELDTTQNDLTSIQTFEVIQTDKFVSVQPIQSRVRSNVTSTPISRVRDEGHNNLSLNLNEVSSVAIDLPASSFETSRPPSFVLNRERVPCYNRPSLPSTVVCKTETPRPKRFGSAITFGVTVPAPASKPPEPTITFDTLINLSQKQLKKSKQVASENANNHRREDGIKHPANLVDGKQKKGRFSDSVIDAKIFPTKMVMGKIKNNSKKYGAAVLKSIKNNARNRNAKLLKLKNTSKLKCNSKKIIRISQLRTNRLNLRNIQQKRSYQSLSSVNNSLQDLEKKALEEESVVQCVENIDNHISLSGNISQIECFTADHNYSHPTDICSVDAINNVAGEVEITSSNIEDEADKMNIDSNTNVEEIAVVQPITSNLDAQGVEVIDNSAPSIDLKGTAAEFLKDSQELGDSSEPSLQNDTESILIDTQNIDKVANIHTAEIITDIPVAESVTDTQMQRMDSDTQITETIDANTQITEKVNTDASIAEKVNTDTLISQKNDTDANKIDTGAERIDTDAEIVENIGTDAEIVEKIGTDAEKISVNAQILENLDTISQIVENVDMNTQSAESAVMDTESAEKIVTDTQIASNIISNLTENNNGLVEGKSTNPSMEETPTVQTTDAEIIKSFPVSGAPDNSGAVSLHLDSHAASLPGEKSAEVQKVSAKEISTAAQATSVQIQEISAKASYENNAESKELSLNDEYKSKQQMPSDEVNAENKTSEVCENSEANDKSEVSEVKVKRGRGRPRKIQCEETTPAQNDSRIKSKSKIADSPIVNEIQEGDSMVQNSIDENRSSGGWRKSERVKKRKLVEEERVEPKVETPKETAPSTSVLKTGKRGRPRKYPLKDSGTNPSVIDDSLKPFVTETEVVDENLRKFSRKGRPRKCVRYADLNSGIESSESLDGLNSGGGIKDKQDDTAAAKEAVKAQEAYEKEKQEEKILPLKKRKQRQNKKDESVDENTGQKQNSESISPDGKKVKIDDHVENEKPSRGGRVLRTRKSTSKKYANDYELDDPLDKDYEEKAAANSESDEAYDPVERNESSTKKWNSKFCRKLAAKIALVTGDTKHESFSHPKVLLSEFKPKKYMWKLLSGTDYYDFLPPLKNSAYFKIKKAWSDSETSWSSLRCFDSLPIDKDSSHITFFTGGPVLCSAWCPAPADSPQYIAVAVSSTLNKYQSYLCTDADKGLIQLWNLGHLTDKLHHPKPVMELGISHNNGFISDMVWCPSGCWENPATESTDGSLPRLGMLAVSCSDSYIRIYSIPQPHCLSGGSTSFNLYSPRPSVLLKPMHGGECMATRKSMCVSVAWQKTDNCERIVGGYGNGMVCVWLINSSATILATKGKDQTIINPYLIFIAHGTPVTSVSFAPLTGARFLVTSSTDKTLKFWDLFDTSLPFFTVRRGASRYAEWTPNVCGAFASLDYGMCSWKGASFFKECGTENSSSRNCGKPCCSIRRSSFTEWLNSQALGDLSGEVSVSFLNGVCCDARGAMFFCRLAYQAKIEFIECENENLPVLNEPENGCSTCLEEVQDVVSVVDTMIENCDITLNLTTFDETDRITATALNPKLLRKKRRRSQLEVDECFSESSEVSQNCLQVTDVINLVTDMKDIVSTMNCLVEQDFSIVEPDDLPISTSESCISTSEAQKDPVSELLEKDSIKIMKISDILCSIIEEVGRRAESDLEISSVLNNIVAEVTNIAEISDVLYNIVSEVKNSAEISYVLSNIIAEVTNRAEISDVLHNIVAEVRTRAEISDVLNNIVAEVTTRAEISDVLNNIVTEVTTRAEISDVLNNIVAEVTTRAEISDVLNNIVAEVTTRAEISDVLNNIVAEVRNRAEIFYILNNIIVEVRNRAEISDILNNIVAEVRNRAEISDILNNIVAEVRNRAEISDILNNIVAEVRNRAEISDILNNIVAEVRNRAEISDILNNIVAEVRNGAKIADLLNNIVTEVTNRTDIANVLSYIVAEVKNGAEISDVLNNIVTEVKNKAENESEISIVLNNIVLEVGNRVENEVEIYNVLTNIVTEVRNRADGNVEISDVLNNIVTEVSTMSFKRQNIENIPERSVESNLTNKAILEMPDNIKSLGPIADTLPDCMEVKLSTNEVPKISMLQNEHSAADYDKVLLNENVVDKTKCDETLTDFKSVISDVLNNIVTEVTTRAEISDVLNNIVAEVTTRAEISDVLNNIVAEVGNRAVISDILNNIVAEVRNRAEISDILNNIVAEVRNRAEISDILNNIVAEVRNKAEIYNILNNIVAEVRNVAKISDLLNNIVTEVTNRTDIANVLSNIVAEVKNGAEISDVLNNIVTEVKKKAENESEISIVLNNIVLEVGNRVENEVEISNVLTNIVTEVRNRADGNVEIFNVLNNIVTEVSTMSFKRQNLENIPERSVESNLTNKAILEMPDNIKSLGPIADTLPDCMEVNLSTNEVPKVSMLQNEHSAADYDKILHNENVVEMTKCDETLTDFKRMHKVCVVLESDVASNSFDSSQLLDISAFGDISCSDTFNELTSVDSPSFPPMLTACNNYVPQIVHEESLDNEPPDLRNETDDQIMLSIDGDSSSSENEMDTDDEMADYLFERGSNFSGDSYLSECSLDSSSSISFSSGESVLSESSSSPVPDEQDMDDSDLPSVNQNNNSENEKQHSQVPSSIYNLVSELSSNLSTTENLDKDISPTASECADHPKMVSVAPPVENSIVEESSNKLEKNVPESSAVDSSKSCLERILLSNSETISEVNNSKETSVPLNCVENSELVTEQVTTDSVYNSLPNVNTDDISSLQSEQSSQTCHSLCADKSSDIQHSSNSSETVHVDRCNEPITVNIENNTTDSVLAESISQVVPEIVKRNIFVSEELPISSCTNSNSVDILDESTKVSADTIPVTENCNRFSNKRLITYENVIAEHGLVFKDMNTADFESIEDISEETSTFPPFDMYNLASINTVSWNPNYGSHLWLFSAGQSGIARLSYISEINREKYFKRN